MLSDSQEEAFFTYQSRDRLSSSCFGTSRPRMVTRSKKMALFSQQITTKCLPLVDVTGLPPKAEEFWFTAVGASEAAARLRQCCQ